MASDALSHYRNVGRGIRGRVSTVTDVKVNITLADSLFAPAAFADGNWGLPADVDSVVVPFELWRNHIYISASINTEDHSDSFLIRERRNSHQ
jgi:hypothetical protein